MIADEVTAAIRAKSTNGDVAAFISAEKGVAFSDPYVLRFPQSERIHRRAGITAAVLAMAVSRLQRRARDFDFNRAAITSAGVRLWHTVLLQEATEETKM